MGALAGVHWRSRSGASEQRQMSFATSQPVVNRFTGTTDVATPVRTALLATNAGERPHKIRTVSQSIRSSLTANSRIHPLRLARILRRGAVRLFYLDLVN